jgi:pyruvate, orthophosphate dikinase
MIAADGILTAKGGVSSHAALVARQMGKVCICGASALEIDYDKKTVTVAGHVFKEGQDYLSIDGTSGTVYAGQIKTADSEIISGMIAGDKRAQSTEKFQSFLQLMKWCGKASRLDVRTNADTPEQTRQAVAFGAVGIGLTRTEHMFFEGDRIDAMREMILQTTKQIAKQPLANSCLISGKTSPASLKNSKVCLPPSACWTHRCMSSFLKPLSSKLHSPKNLASALRRWPTAWKPCMK